MPVSVRKFLGGKVQTLRAAFVQRSNDWWLSEFPMIPTSKRATVTKVIKLSDLRRFGSNPGALTSRTYIPAHFRKGRPLVVVLHGSMQTAEDYNRGTGWSALADLHSFALLFPEQTRSNNAIRGFNWFELDDNRRGAGEPLSIRQMIQRVVADHEIDCDRIFITGLSSGGAMTSVMLATYPDIFAGGAIIAGLPYSGASSLLQALYNMKGFWASDQQLDALVRGASKNVDEWPTISVWHGSDDRTVDPSNADATVRQWQSLHCVEGTPTRTEIVDGHARRVWCDADGREVIEEYRITKMGHGAPLRTGGAEGYGASGDHMLEVGICSTKHIACFWGLIDQKNQSKKDVCTEVLQRARMLSHGRAWRRVGSIG
jgi:poly(hydroxyalkanoate) depolymerase family esterase